MSEISIDQIVQSLPGVSHVVLLDEDGKLLALSSLSLKLPDQWVRGLEQFAGSVTTVLKESGKRITESNETAYQPLRAWFYAGGDWAVCVAPVRHVLPKATGNLSGFVAAFFLTERADSTKIFDAMIGQELRPA